MCAISGILTTRGNKEAGSIVETMTTAQLHRGPDDSGIFCDDQVALGHRRLAIIDLEHGHQPIKTPDGTLVLIAVLAGSAIPALVTGEMIAVGSLLVVAIGTNLLGVTKVKVMNLVPAMFFPIALCPLYELIFC